MSDLITILTRKLQDYPDIKLAFLFGSQANGKVTPESDIDLGLLAHTPLSAAFKIDLIGDLGSEFGRPIDVVDLYEIPEPVTGEVLKGIRLLGSDADYAQLMYRHVLNVADFMPLHERMLRERREAWIK